jgi:DNA-binding transcriptional MerR regulator
VIEEPVWQRPQMSTHYQIGEFAELGGVSAKTLRFYDEIGVFRPASVDPRTGYRRYRPQQLADLASILALKNLGVSLRQVRDLTAKRGSAADRRLILNELKRNIEESIQAATQSLHWINAALDDLGERQAPISVVVKRLPAPADCLAAGRAKELCGNFTIRAGIVECLAT